MLDEPHHDHPAEYLIIPIGSPNYAVRSGTVAHVINWPRPLHLLPRQPTQQPHRRPSRRRRRTVSALRRQAQMGAPRRHHSTMKSDEPLIRSVEDHSDPPRTRPARRTGPHGRQETWAHPARRRLERRPPTGGSTAPKRSAKIQTCAELAGSGSRWPAFSLAVRVVHRAPKRPERAVPPSAVAPHAVR